MLKAVGFAAAMERAIAVKVQELASDCSVELAALLAQVNCSQQAFGRLLAQVAGNENAGCEVEIDATALIGSDADWTAIISRFQPAADPLAIDIAVLWSVYAMLDKMSQYYHQAARQVNSPQQRLLFSSLAELKQKLRRRVGAVEQIQANQVWKEVGFPPGLLGKE